jgi:hypothetical protein
MATRARSDGATGAAGRGSRSTAERSASNGAGACGRRGEAERSRCDSLGLPRPVDEDWRRIQERIDGIVHQRERRAARDGVAAPGGAVRSLRTRRRHHHGEAR